MSGELSRLCERLRQARQARETSSATRATQDGRGRATPGASYQPGDLVFDTITGQAAEVIGGQRENIVVSAPERRNG